MDTSTNFLYQPRGWGNHRRTAFDTAHHGPPSKVPMKRSGLWISIAASSLAIASSIASSASAAPKKDTPSDAAQTAKPATTKAAGANAPSAAEVLEGPDQGVPQFKPPPVSDPMLAPPPAAPRELKSWDEAIAMVRATSPDYVTNFEQIKKAEAQTRIALGHVLPTLNATGQYIHNFEQTSIQLAPNTPAIVTPAADTLTAGLAANWNVIDPRAIYAVGTSKKNVEVTKLSFEDRKRIIAESIANTMLQTLALERVAELNRVGLRTALERLALAKTRFEFGKGTQLDMDRSEQDVENARSQVLTGDETLRQARENLGVALGSATPISAPGDLDLAGFEGGVAKTCHLNDDIEKRPDVLAAKAKIELANRGIRDAELMFSPYVSVGAAASTSNVALLAPKTLVSVSALLTIPLYDGGIRYGQLRSARADAEIAKQALVNARLNAVVESTRTSRAVAVNKETRDVAQKQRDLAARVDARTRDGYAQGAGTSLDLVISAQALRQADINLALLEFQYAQARVTAVLANAECVY